MVKGTSRRVIVVDSPDPKLFEQAIFIVRNDAFTQEGGHLPAGAGGGLPHRQGVRGLPDQKAPPVAAAAPVGLADGSHRGPGGPDRRTPLCLLTG